MTFFPCTMVFTIVSVNSRFCKFLFSLLGSLFTWVFVFLESVHLGVWPHDILPTEDCFNSWFCQLLILLMSGSFMLGVCPTRYLSNWILSNWESGHMTLSLHKIASTIVSINSGFCLGVVLSTWDFVHLCACLLDSVHLGVWLYDILPT